MKLLMITSITEFEKDICALFKNSQIEVYSTYDIRGHKLQKRENIQNNWFSAHRDNFDSKMYFTFTSEELVETMLNEVKKYNAQNTSNNPVKAIVLDIEKSV
ncbi:hypothetical protein [Lutibacter sp. B1]|jgi:hypothetical protein|uniref:hypothetical protein n=1 Tax=Lutibacter sp. B1 TaxID=2725996 RepID=UPI0014577909|nr:hypothetical protein [Lutibacter sp. B1]NLP58446.1 hypothetical protein [Lutibacter sp. B1]